MLGPRPERPRGPVERGIALLRKRFQLVLVVALVLSGAGLVAPSALAAWGSPAPAATPFRADDGDEDDDDERPRVIGRDNENHNASDNGSGCFYPPTNRPKLNLFDPNRKLRVGEQFTLRGKASIAKCGISGLKVKLYWSRNGGQNNWQAFPDAVEATTTASGAFSYSLSLTFASPYPKDKIFFRASTDGTQYGFVITNSNIVKVEKK